MKALKYIAQVLAAAALATLITWLMTYLIGWIFEWILGLSNFWMLVVLVVGESAIIGILTAAASILALPFAWSNFENIVAVIISALITLTQTILWVISAWNLPHHGFIPFITWLFIIVTVVLLGIGLVGIEIKCYRGLED